jgi:hypothetical protein
MDEEEAPVMVVPKESFVSEADMAQQTNDMIGAAVVQ